MDTARTAPQAGAAPIVTRERVAWADSATRERVAWADSAKGACILLVVLWHVVIKHYRRIDWHDAARIPGAWGTLGEQLLPLRMPLFSPR